MTIDGHEVFFVRSDGTRASNSVGSGGQTADGELMFFEIMDRLDPILNGKNKYKRVIIRRVFPCIEETE